VILIVEDEAALGASLERLFKLEGLPAETVPSAVEALVFLGSKLPSLIVLDLKLDGLDGLELLRTIRNDRRFRSVPVMIYTSDFKRESEQAAINAGAQAYFVKGTVGMDEILARARELMGPSTGFTS